MMRPLGLFAVMIFAASCQTYDFERVVPLAVAQTTDKTIVASKRLKPNVMMLVDNSGSMFLPTNPSAAGCPPLAPDGSPGCGTGGNLCPGACPTRISELKNAMNTFLQSSGTIARLGLTVFPSDPVCGPSTEIRVQLPPATPTDDGTDMALTVAAQLVNQKIQALSPVGGTPTGASLQFVGTYEPLTESNDQKNDFRDDFVLLLTDGLPNCNDSNLNQLCSCAGSCSMAQNAACACTTKTCTASLCAKGCLDQDGAVANVKALRLLGIRTIVVGFGAETASGVAPLVLNAMAREGGFARECPMGTDVECGGSCDTTTKQCTTSFFHAANGAELTAALQKISQSFQGDPCVFTLSARPSDPRYLSVVIDGQSVAGVIAPAAATATTPYSYDPNSNKVTFLGALCTQLNASTAQHPVNVEFRIVERL